jgi:pyridoxal/pyridoxine/pyridoxamine kinase
VELITGLVENELHNYSYLLTGYIRCPMFLKKIAEVYLILKKKNPDLIYGRYLCVSLTLINYIQSFDNN